MGLRLLTSTHEVRPLQSHLSTYSMSSPNMLMVCCSEESSPARNQPISATKLTPMVIPSVANTERSGFARRASKAIAMASESSVRVMACLGAAPDAPVRGWGYRIRFARPEFG
jgi:hypothetical protein